MDLTLLGNTEKHKKHNIFNISVKIQVLAIKVTIFTSDVTLIAILYYLSISIRNL